MVYGGRKYVTVVLVIHACPLSSLIAYINETSSFDVMYDTMFHHCCTVHTIFIHCILQLEGLSPLKMLRVHYCLWLDSLIESLWP